jgi:hypothetical protein
MGVQAGAPYLSSQPVDSKSGREKIAEAGKDKARRAEMKLVTFSSVGNMSPGLPSSESLGSTTWQTIDEVIKAHITAPSIYLNISNKVPLSTAH